MDVKCTRKVIVGHSLVFCGQPGAYLTLGRSDRPVCQECRDQWVRTGVYNADDFQPIKVMVG
jgi:hypothetical protein